MNIEAYDLDSLRKMIRGLQEENRSLKAQLRQAGAAYNEQDFFSDRIEACDAGNYSDTFEQDIIEADKSIVISSPVLLREKVNRFLYIVRSRQEAGVRITVITTNPDRVLDSSSDYYMELINIMTNNGINVIPRDELLEHFAVVDDNIVWHGGVNLLGSDDIWDNLIRIKSPIVAAELLELSLDDDRWASWDYEQQL